MSGGRVRPFAVTASLVTGLAVIASSACGPSAGEEGSSILRGYDDLSGGVVFATRSVGTASGYDLFWAPVPPDQNIGAQPLFQLTDSGGDEWQPSVSTGDNGIAFARSGDGILFVTPEGQVQRVSRAGDRYEDSLPAVSHDGVFVAWVRTDRRREIGRTGFFETMIMLAQNDGSNARPVAPIEGIVQDAPRFEPLDGSWRLAWSEFDPASIGPLGPTVYGLRVYDFRDNVGDIVCDAELVIDGAVQRCFGQHLAWPRPEVLVVTQTFFEVFLNGAPYQQVGTRVLNSVDEIGGPLRLQTGFGYSTFPISASYLGDRMIFDGLASIGLEGNRETLGFWIAAVDGTGVFRLNIEGYGNDIDQRSTANYLFSVATPQLIP